MNSFDDFLIWLTLLVPLVFSPGPANISIATLSSLVGFKKSFKFIFGLMAIILIATPSVGFGAGWLFSNHPNFFHGIETLGVFYIFYLAIKIYRSSGNLAENKTKIALGFRDGVMLQMFNAKFYMLVVTMFSQFLENPKNIACEITILTIMLALLTFFNYSLWSFFGASLKKILKDDKVRAMQQKLFSLLLALVGFWLLYENIISWYAIIYV
jgi:threonine/homoserine/homoserine lactone efflux protein